MPAILKIIGIMLSNSLHRSCSLILICNSFKACVVDSEISSLRPHVCSACKIIPNTVFDWMFERFGSHLLAVMWCLIYSSAVLCSSSTISIGGILCVILSFTCHMFCFDGGTSLFSSKQHVLIFSLSRLSPIEDRCFVSCSNVRYLP